MLSNEVKEVLTDAFNEVVRTGGEIGSRREFYIVNLVQTIFSNENEARKFVNAYERELNEFFKKLDWNYME
jgi:hypothetical protein